MSEQKWIPVADRQPNPDGPIQSYQVTVAYEHSPDKPWVLQTPLMRWGTRLVWSCEFVWTLEGEQVGPKVLAWREIPEPYRAPPPAGLD